jgi:hypothetical protein
VRVEDRIHFARSLRHGEPLDRALPVQSIDTDRRTYPLEKVPGRLERVNAAVRRDALSR